MVPHVLADAGGVFDYGDGEFLEGGCRAYAGDHKELWGLKGACGDDDFFSSAEGEIEVGDAV